MSSTNVLSFTSVGSGGLTGTNSAFIYVEDAGAAKNLNYTNLQKFGILPQMAMYISPDSAGPVARFGNTPIEFSSLAFDTGGFTDANSPHIFFIKDSTWDVVQVGYNWVSNNAVPSIAIRDKDGAMLQHELGKDHRTTAATTYKHSATGPWFTVSSGDSFMMGGYTLASTAFTHPDPSNCWWIRGIKRA